MLEYKNVLWCKGVLIHTCIRPFLQHAIKMVCVNLLAMGESGLIQWKNFSVPLSISSLNTCMSMCTCMSCKSIKKFSFILERIIFLTY